MSSLASRIRGAVAPGEAVTSDDIGERLGVQTRADLKKVRDCIKWLKRRGEIEGVSRGVYRFNRVTRRRTYVDIIWHLVRSHRTFNADAIESLSGASRETVREYLQCLVRAGYLRKPSRTTWHLVKDPGPGTPVNSAKCKRLKKMRRRAK